jgi:hypothetical protein
MRENASSRSNSRKSKIALLLHPGRVAQAIRCRNKQHRQFPSSARLRGHPDTAIHEMSDKLRLWRDVVLASARSLRSQRIGRKIPFVGTFHTIFVEVVPK